MKNGLTNIRIDQDFLSKELLMEKLRKDKEENGEPNHFILYIYFLFLSRKIQNQTNKNKVNFFVYAYIRNKKKSIKTYKQINNIYLFI